MSEPSRIRGEMSVLSVLIPAAGGSQRLGQPKQLVRYKGKTLIRHAIENSQSLVPHEIIVVTGSNNEAVKAAVGQTGARSVYNPDWSAGMGSSIALGSREVNKDSNGLLILLCDQWRVDQEDLQRLVETWQSDTNRIVVAETGTYCGPPVIFPSSCFPALVQLKGKQGARSVLESRPELISRVTMKNAVFDLDTPSQLEALSRK